MTKDGKLAMTYCYCRASTNLQSSSIPTQKGIAEEYARRQGLTIDATFSDNAKSGKSPIFDREGGNALMKSLRKGDNLIVAHLDRLSRSFLNFVVIMEELTQRGVIMHIVDMPGGVIDPSSPISQLMVHMLSAFAEFDRKMISIRTKEGFAELRANGRRTSRHAPYGYQLVEAGWNRRLNKPRWMLEPDVQERRIMAKVLELKAGGYTLAQIVKYMNDEWKVPTRTGRPWSVNIIHQMAIFAARFAVEEMADTSQGLTRHMLPKPEVEAYADQVQDRLRLTESEDDYLDDDD